MMQDFKDKVVVITGGASGIGYALAEGALDRGAKVVISDIREDTLADAVASLSAKGEVLGIKGDVAKYEDVEALAQAAVDRFGRVNVLINNAGVFAAGVTWEVSLEQYEWVIGVNQRSVIHGIKAFVPRMIAQGDECHVVTVSSGAGITVNPGFCSYSMTKHAVLALNEALWLDLQTQGVPNIGVTVVMPGVVQSKIMFPEKTSGALEGEVAHRLDNPVLAAVEASMREAVDNGLPRSELVRLVYGAVQNGDLYVLPNFTDEGSQAIAQGIALGRATAQNWYPNLIAPLLEGMKEAAQ
ncbi:SDR family NAD(P)-dependent oxidoreductase [Novosphingobium percolationis]|uniref:SDR family NAD(P)-dependent oxidoreductase n=1 Tax=Novosphingobium percolationis TaxID=2871811 RepID=UPI001CD3A1BE|nr:SDR family NAD(P)-dependent oxidoreductase [Novosphingobium percolationis]